MMLRTLILILSLTIVPLTAQAEKIYVELEGARVPLILDTEQGAVYAGDSCEPLLYIQEVSARDKDSDKRTFKVDTARTRAAAKGVSAGRMPASFEIDGDEFKVVSSSLSGISQAYGKVTSRGLLATKTTRLCKN
ncbi:hypothetical protein Q4485_05315 [Granulosicoccaceae sp. 1_MG-2023]|nr:hypothetical protein [Granulosicoccaceae sp. 1_MG-2023]